MPTRLLYAIVFVVVVSYFMNRKTKRQRETAWTGAVTGVQHQRTSVTRDEDRKDDDWVTIAYRTDDGRDDRIKTRMHVYRQYFASIQAGDRLVKTRGMYLPEREPATAGSTLTTETVGSQA